MEAKWTYETSVDFQRTTRRYIPEGRTLHNHRCENLKSYISSQNGNVLSNKSTAPEYRLHSWQAVSLQTDPNIVMCAQQKRFDAEGEEKRGTKEIRRESRNRYTTAERSASCRDKRPKFWLPLHTLVEGQNNEFNFLHQFSRRHPTLKFHIEERVFCSDKKNIFLGEFATKSGEHSASSFVKFVVFTPVSIWQPSETWRRVFL
jgi:hypothetical protein